MKKRISVMGRAISVFIILSMFLSVFPAVDASASGGLASKPWITDDSIYWGADETTFSGGTARYSDGTYRTGVFVSDGSDTVLRGAKEFIGWMGRNLNLYTHVYPNDTGLGFYEVDNHFSYGIGGTLWYKSGWMNHELNDSLAKFNEYGYKRLVIGLDDWHQAISIYNSSEKKSEDLTTLVSKRDSILKETFMLGTATGDMEVAVYSHINSYYGDVITTIENICKGSTDYPIMNTEYITYRDGTPVNYEDLLNLAINANNPAGRGNANYLGPGSNGKLAIDAIRLCQYAAVDLYNDMKNCEDFAVSTGAVVLSDIESPESVEKGFSSLLRSVGERIQDILVNNAITFESIVYGRVKVDGSSVPVHNNDFSFELSDGNVYGVVGALIYNLLRGILLLSLVLVVLYHLVRGAFINSARGLEHVKDNMLFSVIVLGLLVLMPNIVNTLIYFRDMILSVVGNALNNISGTDDNILLNMTDQYLLAAKNDKTLVSACEYLGMVVITLYFAFTYISMACSMTILFALFPLFALLSFKNRKLLEDWFMFVIGVLATPIIDAMLLIIPLLCGTFHMKPLAQFILCMSIIPSRTVVRTMLGMGRSVGAELVGAGALLMAGRAIGGLARTARNVAGTAAGAIGGFISDRKEANTLEDLSKTEESVNGVRRDKYDYALEKQNEIGDGDFSMIAETEGGRVGGGGAGGFQLPHYGAEFEASLDPETDLRAQRQSVLDRHASVANLDSPLMRDMSPAKRAELLRSRATRNLIRGGLKSAGMAGGAVAGGAIGFGATTFMSPAARIMGTAGGAIVGSELGNAAGSLTYALGSGAVGLGGKAMNWASNRAGGAGAPSAPGVAGTAPEGVLGGEPINNVPVPGTENFNGEYYDEPIANVTPDDPDALEPTDVRVQDGRGEVMLFNNMQAVGMTDEQLQNELASLSNDLKARDTVNAWRNLDNDQLVERAQGILSAARLSGNAKQFTMAAESIGAMVNRNSGLMTKGYNGYYTTSCKMGRALDDEIEAAAEIGRTQGVGGSFKEIAWTRDGSVDVAGRALGNPALKYIGQDARMKEAYSARLPKNPHEGEEYAAEQRSNAAILASMQPTTNESYYSAGRNYNPMAHIDVKTGRYDHGTDYYETTDHNIRDGRDNVVGNDYYDSFSKPQLFNTLGTTIKASGSTYNLSEEGANLFRIESVNSDGKFVSASLNDTNRMALDAVAEVDDTELRSEDFVDRRGVKMAAEWGSTNGVSDPETLNQVAALYKASLGSARDYMLEILDGDWQVVS